MFILTNRYNILEAACGVPISFSKLTPRPEKIARITNVARSNGQSQIILSQLTEPIFVGDKITLSQSNNSFQFNSLPDSYIGDFTVSSVSNSSTSTTISFSQDLPNLGSQAVYGELYKQANISPFNQYIIEYTVETKKPSSTETSVRPSIYIVGGYDSFVPICIFEAKLKYSKSAKILLKMTVRAYTSDTQNISNINNEYKNNPIIKTEYQEIIISDSQSKPCEIIYDQPITTSFYELNKQNNWSYHHENYLLAEFIPNPPYKNNISIRLIKKNDQLLPSRGGKNKIRIIVDPIKLQSKKTSIDKIRNAILNQYDTINNSLAIANLGNKSYDIIVEDKLIKPDDFKDLVIDTVPPETGIDIKFSDVARAVVYGQDMASIPKISILKWNNDYLGELHYNSQLYDQDPILVDIMGTPSTNLSGTISEITNGTNQLVALTGLIN